MSRIKAHFYTKGKFGKRFRETTDTDNEYLYSKGRYPTKKSIIYLKRIIYIYHIMEN